MSEKTLYDKLKQYATSDYYPFHMPGHKRVDRNWDNLFEMDITEIDGFDDYHHPEEIIKNEMDVASKVYHSDKSYYLVNGSTGGMLSAITAVTNIGDEILIARNSHKSVYNAVMLRNLKPTYVYPQITDEMGINGGIYYKDVEEIIRDNTKIKAVVIVSPTYEGVVSDIFKIAQVVHKYGLPLIVDEAHGAHFNFSLEFPKSSVELGADIVIQSLHKTLPSYTQTAILHWNKGIVDCRKLEQCLSIFQSSSPSYIFMSGIAKCIEYMDKYADMHSYVEKIEWLRKEIRKLSTFHLFGEEESQKSCIFAYDRAKIVVGNKYMTGKQLYDIFRDKYHLQMEMSTPSYVVAMTSVCDLEEGYERLIHACSEIDKDILSQNLDPCYNEQVWNGIGLRNLQVLTPYEASLCTKTEIDIENAVGFICGEMVYVYPPGIPFIVPGEEITHECIQLIRAYQKARFEIRGLEDPLLDRVVVIKESYSIK